MKFAHATTLPTGRRLTCILEPEWAKEWSRDLKARCDALLDPDECLDFCWYPGRGDRRAYQALQPGWIFCDIVNFFGSADPRRLKNAVCKACHATDPSLWWAVMQHFDRIGYDLSNGLPGGSPLASGLANLYLARVDQRFVGDAIRFGDNYAVSPERMPELCNHIRDLGLHTKRSRTFTKSHHHLISLLHSRAGIPAAPGMVLGADPRGQKGGYEGW